MASPAYFIICEISGDVNPLHSLSRMRPHFLCLCLVLCAIGRAADAPAPTITSASPNLIDAGGPYFLITVNGSGFADSAVVNWSGNPLTTTFVSSTQLKAAITPDLRAYSGKFNLTFTNPGGVVSNAYPITVSPVLAATSPIARNGPMSRS